MSKLGPFKIYCRSPGSVRNVYRSEEFKRSVVDIYTDKAMRSKIANANALVERFHRGEYLSSDAMRQEGPGWAFRSGVLRFYGVWSSRHKNAFVLTHARIKRWEKLDPGDVAVMLAGRVEFDELGSPPP